MDLIEDKLFLGSFEATKDYKILKASDITHIITVNERRLPKLLFQQIRIQVKHINVCDMPNENLLDYFDDTYTFIENAMCKGAILVHCTLGISRSPTVVIAYLMKKYKLSHEDALSRVKMKRTIIRPNHGFLSQLLLYYEMSYTVDKTLGNYKQFQLGLGAYALKQTKRLPQSFLFLISEDPGTSDNCQEEKKYFYCKNCRRILASEENVLSHMSCDHKTNCGVTQPLFIEPLTWMTVIYHTMKGTLLCPKCRHSVGFFSWGTGHKCACGRRVVPAFALTDVI